MYTKAGFGFGHKNGGFKEHQKNRFEALDRIRAVSCLTKPQMEVWKPFLKAWDDIRAKSSDVLWGEAFAEEAQHILN